MKLGIIIRCCNNERDLNAITFIKLLALQKKYHLCFVNDGSRDKTIALLEKIKEFKPSHVSIINIKKSRGKVLAIKAGIRYLNTRNDINIIEFLAFKLSESYDVLLTHISKFNTTKDNIENDEKYRRLKLFINGVG